MLCRLSNMRGTLKTIVAAHKAHATVQRRAELRRVRDGQRQAEQRTKRLQDILKILCMLSAGSTHLLMTAWVEKNANHKDEWPPLPECELMVADVKSQVGDCLLSQVELPSETSYQGGTPGLVESLDFLLRMGVCKQGGKVEHAEWLCLDNWCIYIFVKK